ncbi:ArsR/SmtB family transcription factor [Desulforhopalus singaporensis]|uniref:Transcriptional regulator, ArsR family n=1 Tax=Desulforhopalus singaporensis TaxID=91360 RepID=A0A1H0NVW5_9BACT|nr:metalloregulator ArsR/SmtB family transcription factor [Desulforhopalus singaporensis]SDO96912.1 transcriptional regulator, ArsR family [Desulforhopalus singaporensis]
MDADRCGARIVHGDKVARAKANDLMVDFVEKSTLLFKAVSDPGRLRILHALLDAEMCVCDLAAFLDATESSVSHQLRLLRSMGLVKNRRDGTVLYYRAVPVKALKGLFDAAGRFQAEP